MPYQLEDKGSYLLINLSGRFDARELILLLADGERLEESSSSAHHRIITFSGVTDFAIQYEELHPITNRRSEHSLPFDIKTGIVHYQSHRTGNRANVAFPPLLIPASLCVFFPQSEQLRNG